MNVQEAALRFSEQSRVILNSISLCWGIDDGEHLFEMFLNQLNSVSIYVWVSQNLTEKLHHLR
jgi:hypothetical protein